MLFLFVALPEKLLPCLIMNTKRLFVLQWRKLPDVFMLWPVPEATILHMQLILAAMLNQ